MQIAANQSCCRRAPVVEPEMDDERTHVTRIPRRPSGALASKSYDSLSQHPESIAGSKRLSWFQPASEVKGRF
eukprot:4668505-Amphidinium_carterae.1